MTNMDINNKISDEELASFLEGSLSERSEKDVAAAIDESKELQAVIEATIDIEDLLMFDELGRIKPRLQSGNHPSNLVVPLTDPSTESKWGRYLPHRDDLGKDTTEWGQGEYRRAADRDENKLTKLKSQKCVKKVDDDSEHHYWVQIIIGIIIMVILALIKSCIF